MGRSLVLRISSFSLGLSLMAACAGAGMAEPRGARGTAAPQTIPGLGTTAFVTSARSAEAQTAFLRGLLLLHLFEYEQAAKAFVAAEEMEPDFAMAYWGEAMTFNHGIWNQVDPAAGKAALDRFAPTAAARAARVGSAREKAYLGAVELLYDGTGTKAERDKRYEKAMQQLAATYPEDRNAQLFYALALLSQSEGVRDVPVYLDAAEISKTVFRQEPNNPGAAHYWIHGMDDPGHAAGALEAARALSKIAPDAGHAQHMCSHIFMALGMWDEVVQANLDAIRVTTSQDRAEGFPEFRCGHYQNWLEYGYFQQGRIRAALESVAECQRTGAEVGAWAQAHPGAGLYGMKNSAGMPRMLSSHVAGMRDVAVIETQDWGGAAKSAIDEASLMPEDSAWGEFTNGIAAAHRGDLPAARTALDAMRRKTVEFRGSQSSKLGELQDLAVGADELSGLIQVKEGHYEAGVADLRVAARTYAGMAFAFGPPVTIKPPEELLGEVLLEKGDAAGARQAFALALERAPQRTQSLLGLARAERLAGDEAGARKTYAELAAIWHGADPDAPGVAEARQAVAKTAGE